MANFIDNLVGEEGIKTDVSISLTKDTYTYLGVSIFLAVIAVWVVSKMIEKVVFKN